MTINNIVIINYKRFRHFEFSPNNHFNVIVGDNESGKSSLLDAIDLVSSGNMKRIESLGLEKLFNVYAVKEFLQGSKNITDMPKMIIELYLDDTGDFHFNGRNNTLSKKCDGIRLVCEPDIDFIDDITNVLNNKDNRCFPFEFYKIRFSTFADSGLSDYGKRRIKTLYIDNSNFSYTSTNDFIKQKYKSILEYDNKAQIFYKYEYSRMRSSFGQNCFASLNGRIAEKGVEIGLKTNTMNDFESDLMVFDHDVGLDSKGMGTQVLIKTNLAIDQETSNPSIVLLEEPENHLSNINLQKLLSIVEKRTNGQLFITTHNNMISTRLDLKNVIMLNPKNDSVLSFKSLTNETASYFMKAPPAGILEFILANKAILVEGPSEMILFDKFYQDVCNDKKPQDFQVQVINVRGLSFKRYLEIGKLINKKFAFVTDNDGQTSEEIDKRYQDFIYNNSKAFFGESIERPTFEYYIYESNKELCNSIFGDSNTVEYMIRNKTECALQLALVQGKIVTPAYIKKAIEWINE